MEEVLILSTSWKEGYWESEDSSSAIYPNSKYTDLSNWEEIKASCPVAGIGIYITRIKEEKFVYLKINDMSYNRKSEKAKFVFETLEVSETKSHKLNTNLPSTMYSAVKQEDLLKLIDDLDEEPPEEWKSLL